MSTNEQRIVPWCGPAFVLLFCIAFWLAGWIPLPAPSLSIDETLMRYKGHTTGIRIAVILQILGLGCLFVFVAGISSQMDRMQCSSLSSHLQLIAGGCNALIIQLPMMTLGVAAFRPDRNPEMLYLLNDLGWLILVSPLNPGFMQVLSVGYGTLIDRSIKPIFPRWFGYMSIWVAITFAPAPVVYFFKDGPFAWNGLFTIYIPATTFFAWIVCLTYVLRANNEATKA